MKRFISLIFIIVFILIIPAYYAKPIGGVETKIRFNILPSPLSFYYGENLLSDVTTTNYEKTFTLTESGETVVDFEVWFQLLPGQKLNSIMINHYKTINSVSSCELIHSIPSPMEKQECSSSINGSKIIIEFIQDWNSSIQNSFRLNIQYRLQNIHITNNKWWETTRVVDDIREATTEAGINHPHYRLIFPEESSNRYIYYNRTNKPLANIEFSFDSTPLSFRYDYQTTMQSIFTTTEHLLAISGLFFIIKSFLMWLSNNTKKKKRKGKTRNGFKEWFKKSNYHREFFVGVYAGVATYFAIKAEGLNLLTNLNDFIVFLVHLTLFIIMYFMGAYFLYRSDKKK